MPEELSSKLLRGMICTPKDRIMVCYANPDQRSRACTTVAHAATIARDALQKLESSGAAELDEKAALR